jgi:hypothetical protein
MLAPVLRRSRRHAIACPPASRRWQRNCTDSRPIGSTTSWVDEFHHAAAASYRRVIAHFQPAFLLGLTATPNRMDGHNGVAAVAVHSGPISAPRVRSVEQLRAGELQVICTVNVFNEGLDGPEADTVLMLRPTESPCSSRSSAEAFAAAMVRTP